MRVELMDMDKFIKVNNCPQVDSPIMFDMTGYPNVDGILSFEKFGLSGSLSRKNVYGYIDLGKKFLHPVAYKALIAVKRAYANVIDGSSFFRIDNKGDIVVDNEKGNNGIDWLYKNWGRLRFPKGGNIRNERIDILKLPKDQIFIDKWLVIPAYYRDVDFSSKKGIKAVDEINTYYTKLINLVSSNDSVFSYMGRVTESRIQDMLVTIYEYLTKDLSGKRGMIKASLLGKTVSMSTRGVISTTRYTSKVPERQQVPFGYTGIPMSHACNLFYPFIVNRVQSFLSDFFENNRVIKNKSTGKTYELDNPMQDYDIQSIKSLIAGFINTPDTRFDPIMIRTTEGKGKLSVYSDTLGRTFTLTDLLYVVCSEIIEDKHVYVTRYPVENFASIYPSKIKLLSTYETEPLNLSNKYFPSYPKYNPSMPIKNSRFIDTIVMNSSYLSALGGDFDGDTVSVRGVWTQEANIEADKLINSPKYIFDITGRPNRSLLNEGVQALHQLTKL